MRRWADYPTCYFNQAGSGPAAPRARRRVAAVDALLADVGAHAPEGLALMDRLLDGSRAAVACCLGVPPGWTVSFCTSATDALNLVAAAVRPRRRRLVASDLEHPSGLLALWLQAERGFSVEALPEAPWESWAERVAEARAAADLVVVSHISYRTGRRAPLAAVERSRDEDDGLLVVDVSQSLAQAPLDGLWRVADVVVGLGHKWLHGPLPTGFLLASPRAREALAVPRGGWHARDSSRLFEAAWRSGPERYEPGSVDVARAAGLAEALRDLDALLAPAARRCVDAFRVQVTATLERCGYPPLSGAEDGMLLVPLAAPRTARATVAAIRALGVTVKDLNPPECEDLLRISLCPLHTAAEVDRLCEALTRVLGGRG